jgi:tRNA uridine 5-carboxymethylaminomethyl modification enzyme
MAGVNAALKVKDEAPFILKRNEAYIGVLIDDLITKGTEEPYRMFTSRAEFRLSLRADNADQRLTGRGIELGCVSEKRQVVYYNRMEALSSARGVLEHKSLTPTEAQKFGLSVNQDGTRRSGFDLLCYPDVSFQDLTSIWDDLNLIPQDVARQLENDAKYEKLLERQRTDIAALKRDEKYTIPKEFSYDGLSGLSTELCCKLKQSRPETLGQASRIDGMTPAALTLILSRIKKFSQAKRA